MRRTLGWVVVAVMLIGGCGGGSDSSTSAGEGSGGADASSSAQSAGDRQYIDPFQSGVACLSKPEVQRKIDEIASRVQNPEREQRAIEAIRDRGC